MDRFAVVAEDGTVVNVIQGDPTGDDRGVAVQIPEDSSVQAGDGYFDGEFVSGGGTPVAPPDPVQERLAALEAQASAVLDKLVEKNVLNQKDVDDVATVAAETVGTLAAEGQVDG